MGVFGEQMVAVAQRGKKLRPQRYNDQSANAADDDRWHGAKGRCQHATFKLAQLV